MTTATVTVPEARGRAPVSWVLSDAAAMTRRHLLRYLRLPNLLVFSTIQPVMFVLLFRYVFGGAIQTPGSTYVDFLMAGIFVQTVTFGAMNTGVGLAMDLQSGLIERFRSLPMARSAVLAGRTTADLARNVFVVALMSAVGFAVGFRVHTSALEFLAALALVLLFGYVFCWVFATVGLIVRDPEAAQAAAFPVMAPLVFASSAFVPVDSMPSWLRLFAEHQPVSVTASAARALVLGGPATSDVLQSLAWSAAILLVFVPLAIWRYQRTA